MTADTQIHSLTHTNKPPTAGVQLVKVVFVAVVDHTSNIDRWIKTIPKTTRCLLLLKSFATANINLFATGRFSHSPLERHLSSCRQKERLDSSRSREL